jgi:hypothetical protein
MKIKREWNSNQKIFEAIFEALEQADWRDRGVEVHGSDQRGEHGEDGTIQIWMGDRTFSLELHEIL